MWTKDSLYVARPDSASAIDTIPLYEIRAVIEMNDDSDSTMKQSFMNRPRNSLPDKKEDEDGSFRDKEPTATVQDASLFSRNSTANCVLQIKTAVDSVLAGRTLYLSTRNGANPDEQRQAIVSSLSNAVEIAKRKVLTMSRFQKSQEQVRWVQGSNAFQMLMAILIMMVRSINYPNHSTI